MKKETFYEKVKSIIASIGWKMFLWGSGTTPEKYWGEIYEQEKQLRE